MRAWSCAALAAAVLGCGSSEAGPEPTVPANDAGLEAALSDATSDGAWEGSPDVEARDGNADAEWDSADDGAAEADGSTPDGHQSDADITLASVTPSQGSMLGGEDVEIRGGPFEQGLEVRFGSRPAEVLEVTSTSVHVRTPPGPVGPADVTVAMSGMEGTLPGGYTYTCTGSGALAVPGDYASVSDALARAGDGDTVIVCEGTYSPSATSERFPLQVANVRLVGAGAGKTILDGEETDSILSVEGASVVEGFTLRRGLSEGFGGAMRISGFGSPEIRWNAFEENQAAEIGGAVYIDVPASPTLEQNQFEGNLTTDSAGAWDDRIGGGAIGIFHTQAVVRSNVFRGNHSARNGGAILILQIEANKETLIEGNLFEENQAVEFGGAIDVEDANPQDLLGGLVTLRRNTLRANGTLDLLAGGALACFSEYTGSIPAPSMSGPTMVVEHNLWENNSAHLGGAINLDMCVMRFAFNRVVENQSGASSGGAVNIGFNPPPNPSFLTSSFDSSDFVDNSSYGVVGGGVLGEAGGNYFSGNHGASGVDATVCPKGEEDGEFTTSSDGTPAQFHLVDVCLSMAGVPVSGAGL